MKRIPLYLVFLIVSLAILANSASHWFASVNPDIAIWLNPLNAKPRLQKVEIDVSANKTDVKIGELTEILSQGIKYEPYDARLYGMLGLVEELNGSPIDQTQELYQHALVLKKTELRALLRSFAYEVSVEETENALGKAELIFRAWPKHWPTIEPHILPLLATKAGYEIARKRFSSLPNGPTRMLTSLARNEDGLDIARRLVLDWKRDGVSGLQPTINTIISELIGKKRYQDAYLVRGLTLNETEQAEVGLIYNSQFNLDPSGSPFDWRLPKIAGVGFGIVNRRVEGNGSKPINRALQVQFLNTPVRLLQRLQIMRLPSIRLNWTVIYSTRNLKGPKPVQLVIKCLTNPTILGKISLPANDNNETTTVTSSMEIPSKDCPLQEIVITNDNKVESWQNRYSGSLFLHSVKAGFDG